MLFTVKPVVTRATSKFTDVFEVEPPRAQIAAHSSVFAVVSFNPPSMQVSSSLRNTLIIKMSILLSKPDKSERKVPILNSFYMEF